MLGRTGAGGPAESTSGPVASGGNEVGGGGRCLSWCKEKWWGMVVAVGEGADGDVQVSLFRHFFRSFTPHDLLLKPPISLSTLFLLRSCRSSPFLNLLLQSISSPSLSTLPLSLPLPLPPSLLNLRLQSVP